MKRPQWVSIIGTFGIILGCFGIFGSVNSIIMPHILEFQKEMWSSMQENFERMPKKDIPEGIFKMFDRMWNMPGWWRTWLTASGVVSLFIATFLVIASILLLQMKPTSIKLFLWASGLTTVFNFIGAIAAISASSFFALAKLGGYIFGLVVALILLIITITNNKKAFEQIASANPEST